MEKNSDEVNVDQRVTCDDVVEISGGEFKKRRKRKNKAVTGTKINGEAEDLLEFVCFFLVHLGNLWGFYYCN